METTTQAARAHRIVEGHAHRIAFLHGMRKAARAVGGGLGPAGWRTLAERPGAPPRLLFDGMALASTYRLADPVEDLGASLLREVARGAGEELGDGTATAVLLAFALYRDSVRALTAGADPEALARGIAEGASLAEEAIGALARPASRRDLHRVATLAAEGDRPRIRSAIIRPGRIALFRHEPTGAAQNDGPSGGATVGRLSVAAPTDSEALCSAWAARKGLAAVRAARTGGVVPGGGLGFLLVGEVLRETEVAPELAEGVEIVQRALEEPLYQLAANQGEVPGHVIQRIRESGFELALNGASGVLELRERVHALDAAEVLRGALRHAASVVRLAVLSGAAVVEAPVRRSGTGPRERALQEGL